MDARTGGRLALDEGLRNMITGRLARHDRQAIPADSGLKRAAVALALAEHEWGGACVLLTERASGLRAHSGQWAFPGGRSDPGEMPWQTALREAEEEIGLALGAEAVLGELDDYPTRSGYAITPVVVWAGPSPALRLNPIEVASVHRVPLDHVVLDVFEFLPQEDTDRPIVRMALWGDHLYAPSAAMLYQFREVALAGRATRVADLDQPEFARR